MDENVKTLDEEVDEAVEWALAARRSGVAESVVAAAFGVQNARLASLAGRMAPGASAPKLPDAAVEALELRLGAAFDERPVPLAEVPAGAGALLAWRLRDVGVVGAVAAVIAFGVLMLGDNPLSPDPTAVPTAVAATGTATPAETIQAVHPNTTAVSYSPDTTVVQATLEAPDASLDFGLRVQAHRPKTADRAGCARAGQDVVRLVMLQQTGAQARRATRADAELEASASRLRRPVHIGRLAYVPPAPPRLLGPPWLARVVA